MYFYKNKNMKIVRCLNKLYTNVNIHKSSVKPNLKQQKYINQLVDHKSSLVLCNGPAGTGKTLFACKVGMDKLLEEEISKLVITRPTVSLGEEMGYLPGNIDSKMYPWMIPIYDSFLEQVDKSTLNYYLNNNFIEICPLAYVRGRTFNNTYLIADEMQNSTPLEMKTLLTRMGKLSKIVITGDLQQSDLSSEKNGLSDIYNKLIEKQYNKTMINTITFDENDIERSGFVKEILNIYKESI